MKFSVRALSELDLHPDYRWDGDYLCFEPYKSNNLVYIPIGDTLLSSQYGLSIEMNENGDGTKIYRMNEITNMLCDRDVLKYATISDDEVKSYALSDKDVLFNRTNSQVFVGRTGIFRKFSDEKHVFASYLVRINPNPDIVTPEYLTAFLNTKYGVQDVKRRARISINQSNVNAEELKRVEIPLLSSSFQLCITKLFDDAFNFIQESESQYKDAQGLLLSDLGLLNWEQKHRLTFVSSYESVKNSMRYDAEYFQPKYNEMLEIAKRNSEYVKTISEIRTFNSRGMQPRYFEDGLVDVVTSRHILEDGLDYENFEKTCLEDWEDQKKAHIKQGDILTYTTGANIGRTACYQLDKPAIASNHVNILRVNFGNPEYIAFVMNSLIGRMQTERISAGSAQEELYPKDIDKFLIPFVTDKNQEQIIRCVKRSHDLKEKSKCLMEIAKRAVEVAIEKDEKSAIKWLDKEVGKV